MRLHGNLLARLSIQPANAAETAWLHSRGRHHLGPGHWGQCDDLHPERGPGAVVSGNYFDVLGVKALIGRTFLPEEDRTPNAHPVVVLGHGLWQRRFGADRAVIGQSITLNERAFTVIGVTPQEFGSPFPGAAIDVWTPVMMKDYVARPHFSLTDRGSRWLMVMGRLRPGATVDQAQANVSAIARQLERGYPQTNDQLGVAVYSLPGSPFSLKRSLQSALAVLMGAVGVVLLIACANVANLLLGRAVSRQKEIALRLALGGSRRRLVRQMLTESLVLLFLGGALGLIVAYWTARTLPAFLPPSGFEVNFDTRPDTVVFTFTFALTVVTTVLCGLAPTLHVSKPDLVAALKDHTPSLDRGVRKLSVRHILVIAQVALSMVALVGAALLVRSLREAYQANSGFDPDRVLLASFDPFLSGYDASRGREFYRQLVEQVRAMPGVQSATLARRLPLTLSGIAFANVEIDGRAPDRGEDMRFNYETVGPHYFETMRIPLVQGRDVESRDHDATQLSLAAVGLDGVMTYTVSQRTRELGVRLAIGATRGNVVRLVLRQALTLSAIGIVVGSIIALMATRFPVHLLYGVGPADPLTFAIVPIVLLAVTLAAGYIPARRAIKIDPLMALRAE